MIQTKLLTKFAFSLALVLAVVAIVTTVPARLEAQAISGDLTGKVVDASGAVVPNATVEAVNLGTGQKITTTTNTSGEYRISNMPPGHYKVTATGNGLTGGYADIRVDLNKTATANITAAVGAAATTVEVVSQAATIDTTTAQIQTNYEAKQAEDLPTASVGLGVLNLSLLQAGVGSSGGVGAGTGPAVSGQRPRNNNFTIEGVDNNDKSVTGPLAVVPNDAVDSFTVLQNNFSPEFGHSSGGQFNTTIKVGTNKFHGRAYEYFQNRNLNAQNNVTAQTQRNNGLTPENTRYDNNRFGGQVGGPIVKDKLFFFSNWEYNPQGFAGASSTVCAPTAAGYAALGAIPGVSANNLAILQQYLPAASAQATANDQTCFPSSSVGGVAIPTGPIGFIGPSFTNGLTTANSVDYNPSTKDQIRFRYIYFHQTSNDTAATNPVFWVSIPYRVHFGSLAEYHTFSPKVTNEWRLGFNRSANSFPVGPQAFPGLAQFPNITIDELGVNIGPDGNAPQFGNLNTYQLTDNVSWMAGKHNLKFGIEGRKYISPQSFTQRARGDYYYCGLDLGCKTGVGGAPASASGLENYLMDRAPNDFGERSTGNPQYAGDQWALYWFANDEFRVTSHLTLNLGIRYEFTGTPAGTGLQSLNSVSDVPGLVTFHRPEAQKKNFAPRVGFAYSPGNSGDTSIRGGFAMAYDVIYDNLPILSLPPQLSGTCDVGSPSGTCVYTDTNFLANGGLPMATGSGITTFPTKLDAQEATSAYIPDQKLPYSESWNFGIQHVFAKKYIAEVRYVGSKGLHLPVQARINRQAEATRNLSLATYLTAPTQAELDSKTVTLNTIKAVGNYVPNWENAGFDGNSVVSFEPWGSSIYHGLQSQLTRNFTNGLQFQAAWTWSHMFDNSTADVFSTVLTPRRAQDWGNFAGESSTSALDHRHRVTISAIYDLPFFKKSDNWFAKNLIGNWEIAPIYTFQSPEYATVRSGVDSNRNGDSAGDRTVINAGGNPTTSSLVNPLYNSAGVIVAYCTCNSNSTDPTFKNSPTNPNAYYIQAGSGVFPTAPRNTLRLPRINNWDLTAVKKFSLREGMEVDFGAQAFNVFNHPQHVPGSLNQINSIGYTSTAVTNVLQAGTTSFGDFASVFNGQERSLGLSLKFIF